ncbi:MAG: SUMF1/EgtB/PvdO family nonheme iron enzyme [Thermoanaerobaculia bacterium]
MRAVESIDRRAVRGWFERNRRRSEALFDALRPEAYLDRPIALRNPIVFYEGHLPAFSVNTLLKKGLGQPGIDERFEVLFERGIDPENQTAVPGAPSAWPPRAEIQAYGREADRRILDAIAREDLEDERNAVLRGGLGLFTILEHELMHQETLGYMWHRLPFEKKIRPSGYAVPPTDGPAPAPRSVRVPAGAATLGAREGEIPFGWDNEFSAHTVEVPAFEIDAHDVTNADYMDFVEAGGYRRADLWSEEGWHWLRESATEHPAFWERRGDGWVWRGMFEELPLPASWPVYVSQAEASAFARWRGARLPTEPEFHRAAYGTPEGEERTHPWGDEPPDATRGHFDFASWEPSPAGSHPAGRSAWGIHDLVGNGWEWTSTVFGPHPGFRPMPSYPQYSADFFDGRHYVMKGASPATAKELLRPSFRNWFRGNYPYVCAAFRCARTLSE